MTWAVYLNEVNLATIGAYTTRLAGYTSAPTRTYPTLALLGRQGVVLTADPEMGARTLQVQLAIATPANTIAARAAAEAASPGLVWSLSSGQASCGRGMYRSRRQRSRPSR